MDIHNCFGLFNDVAWAGNVQEGGQKSRFALFEKTKEINQAF